MGQTNQQNLGEIKDKRAALEKSFTHFAAEFTLVEPKVAKAKFAHVWAQELSNYSEILNPKVADLGKAAKMLIGMHARRSS